MGSLAWQENILKLERAATKVTIDDLVRDYARTVFSVAYSVVRNHADAEDVVQETFLRATRHGRLDSIQNHRAWLGKIAWRLALDRSKRAPENSIDDIAASLQSAQGPVDEAISAEQRVRLLRQLIGTLPQDLRAVIELSTVKEMGSADIAHVLGIPEGTVRTRALRARQMLKQKLAVWLERKK